MAAILNVISHTFALFFAKYSVHRPREEVTDLQHEQVLIDLLLTRATLHFHFVVGPN